LVFQKNEGRTSKEGLEPQASKGCKLQSLAKKQAKNLKASSRFADKGKD
jgi:hypothetical protein